MLNRYFIERTYVWPMHLSRNQRKSVTQDIILPTRLVNIKSLTIPRISGDAGYVNWSISLENFSAVSGKLDNSRILLVSVVPKSSSI